VVGYARAAHSLTLANRALAGLGLALLLVVPLALLAAWLGGNWLAAKAVRPVEAAWERERQFTRDAAHELRTPLAVMQAHAELAAQLPGAAALRDKLAVLHDTARKMSRLVSDLLTLSREDAGVGGQALTFAFDELLEDEVEALAPLAVARGVTLEVAPLPEGQLVRGDPGRLGQTVRNVLDNALRYAGASGQVSVFLRRVDGHLALTVGNTGPAIPAPDRDAIFERFYRADAGRQANPEGGGRGLPISRAIARAHGGELALTSAAGEATVFTLRLPLLT
jgi:signal transduction histidine kinase